MNSDIEIKVTRVGERWHARLFESGVVKDESACELKCDIGWMCRELCRWYDKLGGVSPLASAARDRQSGKPIGKIWNRLKLDELRKKRKFPKADSV